MAQSYSFLLMVAAAVVATDQIAKSIVTEQLRSHSVQFLSGLLRLDYTRNSGAAFSILPAAGLMFAVIAVLVSAGILFYYRNAGGSPLSVRIGLGLVLGGALGNLVDRIRLGYVVDFIDLRWWPVFNVADCAVVIGVALLVLASFVPAAGAARE